MNIPKYSWGNKSKFFFLLAFLCFIGIANSKLVLARPTEISKQYNLHNTSDLLNYLTRLSPANPFLKGEKPVSRLTYYYSNWNGKGGIQIFCQGEKVKMLNIAVVSTEKNLPQLKTPIPIEKLIGNLLSKKHEKWLKESLIKLTKINKTMHSSDQQLELGYDQQVQKLTITLRMP